VGNRPRHRDERARLLRARSVSSASGSGW
jgi:hypothetical protein